MHWRGVLFDTDDHWHYYYRQHLIRTWESGGLQSGTSSPRQLERLASGLQPRATERVLAGCLLLQDLIMITLNLKAAALVRV